MQIKVWLLGISPMVWRRVLVPSTCTLRELHGIFQIAMGWAQVHGRSIFGQIFERKMNCLVQAGPV